MNKKYAAIEWSDEPNNYSLVKIARIKYDAAVIASESELLEQIFEIQLDKSLDETSTGKVLQVGSRAKISKVVADLASKASELSILENEERPCKGRTFKGLNKRKGTNSEEIAQPKTFRLEEFEGVQQENLDCQPTAEDNVEENFQGGQEEPIGLLSDVEESTENDTFPNSEAPDEKDKIIQALQLKLRKQDRCIKKLQSFDENPQK